MQCRVQFLEAIGVDLAKILGGQAKILGERW